MDRLPSQPSAQTSAPSAAQILTIARSDRWQACYRLQELDIPCTCLEDGRLQVDITTPTTALQIWSVLHQLQASRQQLSRWLEQCWQAS